VVKVKSNQQGKAFKIPLFFRGTLATAFTLLLSCGGGGQSAEPQPPPLSFAVTPSAGVGGEISPNTPQTISQGSTTSFTVTPDSGYRVSGVDGTCGGSLSGNSYTTSAITAACTVEAAFSELDPVLERFSFRAEHNSALESDLELDASGAQFSARLASIADVKSLVPSFTFQGAEVTVEGVVQTSGEDAQDFTNVLSYTVSNESGISKTYEIDLVRFTGLPIIYLSTNVPVTSKEEYVAGTFSLDGWRSHESIEEMEMKIRGRGNSTWALHPKKPYQLKLESKRSLFGMSSDKKWLFLAEYSDKTLIRNRLAFELGRLSKLRWTPSGHFAEVVFNGMHDGVYHVTEKVEDGANRVDIGDTGFLLEIDQPERIDPDDVFFRTENYLVNIKEPSVDNGDEQYLQVSRHINEFERVLFSSDFSSVESGYATYVDIDTFVDWFLVNEIAKNVDAQWYSSIFFHWVPGDKIKMGPIWDFDLAFGNVDYADATYPEGWWVRWNTWIGRMLEDPRFAARVKERFAFFDAQRPQIKQNIQKWAEDLQFAQAENDSIWQTIGEYVWPNPVVYDTYEEEVTHLSDWLDARMDWMADSVEQL
jgi:hypothetical protein